MSDRKPSPQLGLASEALVHERASATPSSLSTGRASEDKRDAHAEAPPFPRDSSLRAIEEWFVATITTPHTSPRLDADAARLLTRGPKLDAADRLALYRYGYRARLVECLADDYPAVKFALGDEAFEALCLEYIERYPSSAPSLNFFGRHMAHFCREDAPPFALREFAADLASLEWALVEVLHARVADRLSPEALAAIPVERWSDARLPAGDAVRVLRSSYPVNTFFQAFKSDQAPQPADFPRNASATAVYRTEMTLWRMGLTPAMATLLESLFAGRSLGAALEALEDGLTAEDAAEAERNVMAWFREWVAAGFFARIELP